MRLAELSDLTVPIELTYTAQRHLNIKTPQFIPRFPSDDFADLELHQTAHTVFARTAFSVFPARVYVFWPFLSEHNKTVINDADCALWIDGIVAPALRRLDSCAFQDHPKSWQDAYARAGHRAETQVGGAREQAGLAYTLPRRFTSPLVAAMREIVEDAAEGTPLFRFRSFQFVVVVHDLKKAFNAEAPRGFDAFAEFQRTLTATFRPEYLQSSLFLDRSFADFGVEYNLKKVVTEPTTLLVRRTCITHRFSTALLRTAPGVTTGVGQPELFTTYSLHDAATGRLILPARAPISSIIPTIKGYNLHKHTYRTHLRHEYAGAFTLPYLELLCLNDTQLKDVHQAIKGTFHHRTIDAIHGALTRTVRRLQEALKANERCHNGVRIEPRISMGHLLRLQEQETWPSLLEHLHRDPEGGHPFVFAVATADLNAFISNYIQRMLVALAVQRFDLYGPIPAWNSVTVRHRLGTTAALLQIMATFFEGHEHQHWKLQAAKYTIRQRGRARLGEDGDALDFTTATVAALTPDVRIGLLMGEIIRRHGCYWLPHELFDFQPRVQLKAHLLTRVTVARPRLLWKSQINWSAPIHSRRAYEGDVVFDIVVAAARQLKQLRPLPVEDESYLRYHSLRTRAWLILKPVAWLLARAFFRYIASLTDKDPFFLPLEDNEFGVPFNALTYGAVTRLLGVEPVLATPRDSKKEGGKASWDQRLRQIFDDSSDHQWQKNASFMVELRRWLALFQEEGVQDCYLQLWRRDIGLLMRPHIWILPSHEKKTLFRMDRLDGQQQIPKRMRTRWYLPGVAVECREPVMTPYAARPDGPCFQPRPGHLRFIDKVCEQERKLIDPYAMARKFSRALQGTDIRNSNTRWQLIQKFIDKFDDFSDPPIQWFQKQINDHGFEAGRWVPFWTCGAEFPADDMQELQRLIEQHRENFAPEGGFQSFVEEAEDEDDDDCDEGDEAYEDYDEDST
jgi:hypothetical protein